MITSDTIRGYNDLFILAILAEKDSYGYEIAKEIQDRTGGRYSIKETTLYSAVARLESNGHVVSYYGDETFGKRRTYYRITGAGRTHLLGKRTEWELVKDVVDRFIKREV